MCSGANSADVFAGGAVIGESTDMGGGGGGGNGSTCSAGIGNDGGLDCMGVSWIYYEATGYAGESGVDITFSPRIHQVSGNVISSECAAPNRGFWAFGVGGRGEWKDKEYPGGGTYVFSTDGDAAMTLGGTGTSGYVNVYATDKGKYGLYGIYPWGYQGSTSRVWSGSDYRTFDSAKLNHHLYKKINGNYVEIYRAAKYGTKAEVMEQFKVAYRYYHNGADHTGNSFPSTLGFFCYWEGMDISEFDGYANVSSGSVSGSTGWTKENRGTGIEIECKNNGCDASFDLGLRRTRGDRGTSYTVYKNGVPIGNNPSFDPGGGRSVYSKTETLKPGQTVCYGISFISRLTSNAALAVAYTEACATAKVTNFQGKSSVTGATTKSTEWQNSNKTETAFIENCSPTTGCQVSFNHRLRRPSEALGWTNYVVKRTSNMTTSDKAIANNDDVDSGTFNSTETEVSSSGPFTLYPGMVVCETLTFKPNNDQVSVPGDVTTKICASALGKAQPDDPSPSGCVGSACENDPDGDNGNDALVDIEVKNNSVTKFNTYRRVVYGKPGDLLTYRGSYNPNLQYTYYLKPEKIRIDGGTVYPNTTQSLATMFNAIKSPGWNNDIIMYSTNFASNSFSQTYNYVNGSIAKHSETNDHSVVVREVGRSLNENAEINYPNNSSIKTTPVQVAFTSDGTSNLGNVSTVRRYRIAYARIPYNYTTDITVPIPDPEEPKKPEPDPGDPTNPENPSTPAEKVPAPEIVYAGENKPIDVKVDIKPKPNSVTNNPGDPDYATRTGNSTVKIIVYLDDGSSGKGGINNYGASRTADLCSYYGKVSSVVSENWRCSDFVTRTGSFNESGNMNGNSTTFPTSFNVPDLDAGQSICVAAAIFPSNSGLETNWDSVDGNNAWRISDSRCFVVAKRPNLQVLGGGMFSSDKLFTSVAIKRNIYGFYPVILNGSDKSNTTVFGSWVEHQILSVGNTAGIASGASTGYFGSSSSEVPASGRTPKNGGLDAKGMFGLGGSYEGAGLDYCIRVPLTIANTNSAIPCRGRSIAGGYVTSSDSVGSSDKDKLIARFTQETESSGIDYIKADGDYILGATITPKGAIKVIHATGSITIDGDLVYEDNFTSLAQIPKLIIYAEKNILIGCGVTRIDAVLIAGRTNEADGIVNTCRTNFVPYTGDIASAINWKHGSTILVNTPENSNPLKITGTVIANKLVANRTYGAAKGINSVVPAETIDYDATLYGWGMRESEASASGKLQTVYLHEVAPRY
ncbi:hypothetical protein IJH23_00365 [Candidatus Saccharibacteria bacterium]|nr:hypothetical protein [Candidatus Saccharibacteria bacterium]